MKEQYYKWYTRHLSRDFEMMVYGHAGYPIILFPTSKGHFNQNKDFGLVDSARYFIDSGKIRVYCPDGIDESSWYNYSIHPADRVKTHMAYENVIMHDVVEYAIRESGHGKVGLGGASFGSYHAANTAFRHPDKIGYLISLSGAFDIKQFIMGYYDNNCFYNNPPDYLPGWNDPWFYEHVRRMGIVLGTGEHDSCLGDNLRLSKILGDKGINHWLDVRQGAGHDWPWWNEMFPFYLSQIHEAR
jgi:esterase/lipase superfamily enzyme